MNLHMDNLKEELKRAADFYNPKNWSAENNKIWQKALSGFSITQISDAFEAYYQVGSYMPKPADIIKLIKINIRPPAEQEAEEQELRRIDPIIESAWIRFNLLQSDLGVIKTKASVQLSDDEAILICNMEAFRLGYPCAIEKEFWLSEVWGYDFVELSVDQKQNLLRKDEDWEPKSTSTPDYSDLVAFKRS